MQQDPTQLALAQFKKGSFITVEGKEDTNVFYIIRSGAVQVQKEATIVEEDTGNILNPGDFFGVISTMSSHPHIETAIALTDVVLIVVRRDQFGILIQKNAPIALKIIRSFSRKLRFFDAALTRMNFKTAVEEDPSQLIHLGEFYQRQQQYPIAAYAYMRYIQNNPVGNYVSQAQQNLAQLKQYLKPSAIQPHSGFTRNFEDNEVIFLEHEPGQELYIIQQGKVKITKIVENNEIMLAVLNPGDIFGEMAILENKPRNATAISFGATVMLAVNKDNFQGMVVNQPAIATKIITLLSERIWTSYHQFANLLISDPLGRVYDTLYTQVQKNRVKIQKNGQYTFDFGTKELITMTGLQSNEGKMVVRQLFENNKFKLIENKIQVTDLEELAKQVSFYKKQATIQRKVEQQAKKY